MEMKVPSGAGTTHIHPINNIQYFQQLMQTFMLAEVVSSDSYHRKIIFTK